MDRETIKTLVEQETFESIGEALCDSLITAAIFSVEGHLKDGVDEGDIRLAYLAASIVVLYWCEIKATNERTFSTSGGYITEATHNAQMIDAAEKSALRKAAACVDLLEDDNFQFQSV